MTNTVYSRNSYHLGDNLIFLHLLRALAKQRVSQPFVHFCHAHLIPQLQEAVADLPNILLEPFESRLWEDRGLAAVDTWKNHQDAWVKSPLRWDWSAYTLWHHQQVARRLGFESPFTCREHLLFDWPIGELWSEQFKHTFFVCNSEPSSGQFGPMRQHDSGYLDELILALYRAGNYVVCTKHLKTQFGNGERGGSILVYDGLGRLTITQLAQLSLCCRHHIMIATGPMWPTLNTHNHHYHEGRRRIVLLDNGEKLNMPFIDQRESVEQIIDIAGEEGWL